MTTVNILGGEFSAPGEDDFCTEKLRYETGLSCHQPAEREREDQDAVKIRQSSRVIPEQTTLHVPDLPLDIGQYTVGQIQQ